MKKAVTATTTASGAAVSRSRMTEVQSVYIRSMMRAGAIIPAERSLPMPASQRRPGFTPVQVPFRPPFSLAPAGLALLLGCLAPLAARAGIQFENCVHGSDGSITCDTVPTGNTLMNDESARYGLLQNASPGWSEFDPYEGFEDEFGGNET